MMCFCYYVVTDPGILPHPHSLSSSPIAKLFIWRTDVQRNDVHFFHQLNTSLRRTFLSMLKCSNRGGGVVGERVRSAIGGLGDRI